MKIGISGTGNFSRNFIPLIKHHPLVKETVLADIQPDLLVARAAEFGIDQTLASHALLCDSDVDAIAIFSQPELHAPMALEALRAGKHVYCAVPIAMNVADILEIINCVQEGNLVYMTGETSYYYPHTIYCRDRFRKGDFGHFVYGESSYMHDMSVQLYETYKRRAGNSDWKKIAGAPPMHYATHTVGSIVGVTGARMTHVSCLGYRDRHEDGVFREETNLWSNPFSNQTALMQTSDGGMVRINEFRRIGWKTKFDVTLSIYGTNACFEENGGGQLWTTIQNGVTDLNELLSFDIPPYSKTHPKERLPREYHSLSNGHFGSHQFLIDDFVKAVHTGHLPPTNVWEAAKYCVPGLTAHESAISEGAMLEIPHLGEAPVNWPLLENTSRSTKGLL